MYADKFPNANSYLEFLKHDFRASGDPLFANGSPDTHREDAKRLAF